MVKRADISPLKQLIVDRLQVVNPEKVILFGSYAYGNPTEDSDIDICVVEKDQTSKIDEATRIRKSLGKMGIAIDILVSTVDEYDFYKDQINSVYYDIDRKGEVLWSKTF